jgi:hypothetical protein
MTTTHRKALAAAALLAATGLSGCGNKPAEQPVNPFASAPYVLVPDRNGTLELRTPDGKSIAPSATAPEVDKGQLDLQTGTIITLKSATDQGQCWKWIYFNGRWYQVPC